MPLHMRLPKLRGFKNPFRTEYQVVNLDRLRLLFPEGGQVSVADLVAKGAVRDGFPVKVLGTGEISVKVEVEATSSPAPPRRRSRPPAARSRPSDRLSLTESPRGMRTASTPRGPAAAPGSPAGYSRVGPPGDRGARALVPSTDCGLTPPPRRPPRRTQCSPPSSARSVPRTCARSCSSRSASSRSSGSVRTCRPRASATPWCRTVCSAGADGHQSGFLNLANLFSGGALLQLSVFALGIMPYITASIIIQLLTVVIPRFEALKEEGQSGQTSSRSTPAT